MEILCFFISSVAIFYFLAFYLFKDNSEKVILFVVASVGLFDIYLFQEFSEIFYINTDDEKLLFFTELIRPIIYSNKSVILLATFTIITTIFDNHQVLRIDGNIFKVVLGIEFLSVLTRVPGTLEGAIAFSILEIALINLLSYLRDLNSNHKLRYFVFSLICKVTNYFFPTVGFDFFLRSLILVFSFTIKTVISIGFTAISLMISDDLHEENRMLLILKSYSKISNNYLFYFYYGGKSLKRHSNLLAYLLIFPFVNYLFFILFFGSISFISKYCLMYTISMPFGYLLSLQDDKDNYKNTKLNCLFIVISLVFLIDYPFNF